MDDGEEKINYLLSCLEEVMLTSWLLLLFTFFARC